MSLNSSTVSSRFNTNIRTHRRTMWLIVMIAGVVMQMTRAPAQVSVSNASLAAKVADGRPWKMTMEDGRPGTLILFQNGTGKMTGGPMELTPKWRSTSDGLCLKPGALLPERCVQLIRTSNGYVGLREGKQTFKLER